MEEKILQLQIFDYVKISYLKRQHDIQTSSAVHSLLYNQV